MVTVQRWDEELHDIDLMGGSENELQDRTTRLEEKARTYGMKVSSEKSKVLVNSTNQNTLINIRMNGPNIEEVDSFKHLKSTSSKGGISTMEIKSRGWAMCVNGSRCVYEWHTDVEMPLLEVKRLTRHRERRLAYMLLSFIGNGYVWQEGDAGVVKMVPRQLAVPWCIIADNLGVKPALSHPCFVLSNWKMVEPSR
ncbi:hypothetical protein LSAT2_023837 [Lamellibrachia satsuma]|nr:hypothetical protein LSAT2_023837 [Lamellibrachia satsuma]